MAATPTYAELLDTAKQALSKIMSGVAVEWSEGGHKVRLTDPDKMLAIIERLEQLAADDAGTPTFREIVSVDL